MQFEFVDDADRSLHNAKIKVVGVGGAGGNAVNNMIDAGLQGVEFIVANTDRQALERSLCSNRIQLGNTVTMGLGAGADPEKGRQAAEESAEEIRQCLGKPDMVFIAAGMGGGTGTGAAPVVARLSKDKEINALTVAVVTKPFRHEGDRRMERAMEGIRRLKEEVDSLIIIPNERLKAIGDKAATFRELMVKADEVLHLAVRGISDLMLNTGFINLDFRDVEKVMSMNGTAIMGMGRAEGANRTLEAAKMAINNPLLEDLSIKGAKGLLMNIVGPSDMTMDEIDEASSFAREEVSGEAEILWGVAFDDTLGASVKVTIIATGIDTPGHVADAERMLADDDLEDDQAGFSNVVKIRNGVSGEAKIRDLTPEEASEPWTVRVNGVNLDEPTFMRQKADIFAGAGAKGEGKEKRGLFGRRTGKENLDYPTFMRVKPD